MADRYDKLNHNTVMASVGSMSRRWREAIRVPKPHNIEDFYTAEAAGGLVLADEMGAAITQTTILMNAIRTTSYLEPDPLPDLTVEAMRNELTGERPPSAVDAIEQIAGITDEVYRRLKDLRMADWKNEATWGSMTISISDLAKGVSRVNAERLARATRTLASVN